MPYFAGGAAVSASSLAGFEFGYDQITSSVSVTATVEASGTTVITCAAHSFDGAAVYAEFYSPSVTLANVASAGVFVLLFEGATEIGQIANTTDSVSAGTLNIGVPVTGKLRFTPTAASHTYTVTAIRTGGNGTINAGAGGTGTIMPTYIRFTKA